MKFDRQVWIVGAANWFPATRDYASAAIQRGELSVEHAELKGVDSVAVATDISAPEMAVRATSAALADSGLVGADIDFLFHSWLYHQGHDLWSVPHFIANAVGAVNCWPMSMHQGCDGGVLSLYNATLLLSKGTDPHTALVTASDRFVAPGVDRWNNSPTFALGDAGSAVVLSNQASHPGYRLEIAAISARTAPVFEVLNRGDTPFSDFPLGNGIPSQESAVGENVIESTGGMDFMVKTGQSKIREVFDEALAEAGITDVEQQLDLVMLPRIGASVLENSFMPILEEYPLLQVRSGHADSGHLGCGDLGADLAEIMSTRALAEGRHAALFGLGGWFTWTCTIVKGVTA
ncbi:ketoacyl-ACP synthase III family protein [Nocardia sp. NPDC058497]|uniref:ketoacyl-ACP synthase III family protein n=1 Tax=Nocardia sp. NPDC058497 TaxID=3346529 RepID=UPI003662D805